MKQIPKNSVKTFGCRLNLLESELIEQSLDFFEKNILVVNTCAVTNEAEKQAKQYIRKISKDNPDLKIVATGCSVQTRPEEWSKNARGLQNFWKYRKIESGDMEKFKQ